MLLASLLFAVLNVLVKWLGHIPAVEVVFFRALLTLIISYGMLRQKGVSVWGKQRKILFLRGLFGTMALVLLFMTFQEMRLATATTIHYLAPIFTVLIAAIFLRERVGRWQPLFFLISFAGVLLIRGFDPLIDPFYLGLGIVSAFFSGCAYNCIRYLNTSEEPLVIVFYFPLVAMPITGLASAFVWVMPRGWDWLVLASIGITTQLAQLLLTKAYQQAEAARVAGVSYLGIIYAIGLGWWLFDETYFWVSYVGMGVVLLGVVLNVLFPKKTRLKSEPE